MAVPAKPLLLKSGGVMTRSVASFLAVLVLSCFAGAQMQASTGDADLYVRVRTGNERRIESPIQVQLLGSQGVIATAQIIGGDSAHFHVVSARTYRVTVSGTEIETVTSSYFEVNPLEPAHTETVQVKLTNPKSNEQSASGAPTISVSDLKVPKKAAAEMKKGMESYSKGDMQKASAHFEKAIAEYPQYARAYDMLGVITIKSPDRAKARELFSKSIQVDGTFIPAYLDLARMDLQDQNYLASENLLGKAIAVNSSVPEAMALLASTEFANKEYDKALVDVERTHALPNHERFAEVHLMAGKVLSMKNHAEAAITQFQLFLKEKPDSPEVESARRAVATLSAKQQP
jgi:Tfp pilus assembly protein PilF